MKSISGRPPSSPRPPFEERNVTRCSSSVHGQPTEQSQLSAVAFLARRTALPPTVRGRQVAGRTAAQLLEKPLPAPAPMRATTVGWFGSVNRNSPITPQLDSQNPRPSSGSARAGSQRTSAQTDLLPDERSMDARRTGQDQPGAVSLQAMMADGEMGVDAVSPMAERETRAAALEKNAFCQQAAYILARQVLGRPLSNAQTELMWRVSEVRTEVLKMLPLGRSNVVVDVAACDQQRGEVHSTYRALAARQLKWDIPNGTSKSHAFIPAALTAVAGSGSCGELANLAMHLVGRVLKPGERLIKQQAAGLDHSWVRVEGAVPEGGQSGCGPAVILDAWADGPVIDPEDGGFIAPEIVQDLQTLDMPSAKAAYEAFQRESERMAQYEKPIADRACKLQKKGQANEMAQSDDRSGLGLLSRVVVRNPTLVLDDFFLGNLENVKYERTGDLSTLIGHALEIARGAPNWAQFEHTPNMAIAIAAATWSFETPENRLLTGRAPRNLGLIAPE